MTFITIMDTTPAGRVAKYQDFKTEAEADAHALLFLGKYPNAFVVARPSEPIGLWRITGKVITIESDVESTDPRDYPLSPRNFNWMAARFGYDKAIDSVLAVLEASDIDAYAEVSGDVLGAKTFRFQRVLEVVNDPRLKRFIPAGVDTSEVELSRVWMIAKDRV